MSAATELDKVRLIGPGVDRVDGVPKTTGAARYPGDVDLPEMTHAVLVRSVLSRGVITALNTAEAEASPGVLAVLTHRNAGRLRQARGTLITPPPDPPLQAATVTHYGQYLAVVVAETPQQATTAADKITIGIRAHDASLTPDSPSATVEANPYHLDQRRGDVAAGLAAATMTTDGTYRTSACAHNPIGLFACVAYWEGDRLTVHDSTQNPFHLRDVLAKTFGLRRDQVRVLVPYVGGAFGAGLRVNPHTLLAALAARVVGRPVKLVLTRPQMFTGVGHRPATVQQIRLGATAEGTLTAIDHEATTVSSRRLNLLYPVTLATVAGYECPNVSARDQRTRLDIPPPAHMRAPGEAEANFAVESSLDELAHQLEIDPIDLRLRNHAARHPQTGGEWSSNAVRECYAVGAERFGWSARDPAVGSMRDGPWLVGYGMAGAAYGHQQVECHARATLRSDGTAHVCSGTTEIGVGTWTVMTQIAAESLGLPVDRVEFDLGDTLMPRAPYVGGSGLTVALGTAVRDACRNVLHALHRLASSDRESPLYRSRRDDVTATDARLALTGDLGAAEPFTTILERHGLQQLEADGRSKPPRADLAVQAESLLVSHHGLLGRKAVDLVGGIVPAGAFAARFVEIRIDPELGLIRVARVVSVIDAGRVVNEKTARSQIIGGTVQAIGMTLFEQIARDPGTGRIANPTFGDYLIPVNADIPDLDVAFVGAPDPANPLGVKGLGEIGYIGVPAAIANAVFHATGRRLRRLPITVEDLL